MNKENFHFPGKYTLRGINNNWFIYDRETYTIIQDTREHTFKKATEKLKEFKIKNGDVF
jgi:hypothetical protein